jgi:hypothetical protein
VKYAVEMASCGMICIPSFINIGVGVQAMLRFCLTNLRRCKVLYYWWKEFMKYAFEMTSCGVIYTHTKFLKDSFRHSEVIS